MTNLCEKTSNWLVGLDPSCGCFSCARVLGFQEKVTEPVVQFRRPGYEFLSVWVFLVLGLINQPLGPKTFCHRNRSWRAGALASSTAGCPVRPLHRSDEVIDTGAPITVPVGEQTSGSSSSGREVLEHDIAEIDEFGT